jgi:hypothetical protein
MNSDIGKDILPFIYFQQITYDSNFLISFIDGWTRNNIGVNPSDSR